MGFLNMTPASGSIRVTFESYDSDPESGYTEEFLLIGWGVTEEGDIEPVMLCADGAVSVYAYMKDVVDHGTETPETATASVKVRLAEPVRIFSVSNLAYRKLGVVEHHRLKNDRRELLEEHARDGGAISSEAADHRPHQS